MKKSLVALAVLAASGAAMAQSAVTLYGIADVWVGSEKINAVRTTVMKSGGVSGSRWGIKGEEDLGGGLKAIFTFEQGVALDTGAAAGFNREASVGFSGGFGEVKFGRVWTALDDVAGASNSVFDSALAATSNVYKSGDFTANPNNGIRYTSPSFGGFSGAVSYSLDEKSAAANTTQATAFNVQYANGPLAAQLGYQTEEVFGATKSDDYLRLGASYDFGVATAKFSYGTVDYAAGDEVAEYQIGVDVPLSAAMTLSAGYANSETETSAGAKITERDGFGIAVAYSLSKRTTVYGGFHRSTEDNAAGVELTKNSVYAIGVKHTF